LKYLLFFILLTHRPSPGYKARRQTNLIINHELSWLDLRMLVVINRLVLLSIRSLPTNVYHCLVRVLSVGLSEETIGPIML